MNQPTIDAEQTSGSKIDDDTVSVDVVGADETAEHPHDQDELIKNELALAEARVLRAYADLDNYKKRFDREIARRLDIERDKFIHALLQVADNLRRALRVDTADSSPYRDGLMSVMRQIELSLAEFGAEQIPAEKGQQMDPNLHEALTTLDIPGAEHGSIVEVSDPGYAVGERIVRPAKVIVAKSEDE